MSQKQAQKRTARNKTKELYSLLTSSEKKLLRKARVAKRVVNKKHHEPRVGVKGWIIAQRDLKNLTTMKELKLI